MRYMGSKRRIADDLITIMQPDIEKASAYVEPFTGGANVICEVKHKTRIAADNNKYLIAMFKCLQRGVCFPRIITREMHKEARSKFRNGGVRRLEELGLIGWVGFMASFRADFFAGYNGEAEKSGDYTAFIKNIDAQAPKFKGIKFIAIDYTKLEIPSGAVVYCDPPYAQTTEYKTGNFDSKIFWEWCKYAAQRATVYVSEYSAPKYAKEVWAKEIQNGLRLDRATEKLFKVKV